MGGAQSISSKISQQNDIIQQIHKEARELSETYSKKFLDPSFCTQIALIYTDKLNNSVRKHVLDGVAVELGLVVDSPQLKDRVCESIVKHYTDRMNLIAAIVESLSFCSNRIFALTSGPRCNGNPEEFDQAACTQNNGTWVNYIVPPNPDLADNKQWYTQLKTMQDHYVKVLARLLDILKQLKDFDQDIDDEGLKKMGIEVGRLIDSMQGQCSQLYKLALVTPTFTEGELNMIAEQEQISEQESAARIAALRVAKGLPETPAE